MGYRLITTLDRPLATYGVARIHFENVGQRTLYIDVNRLGGDIIGGGPGRFPHKECAVMWSSVAVGRALESYGRNRLPMRAEHSIVSKIERFS